MFTSVLVPIEKRAALNYCGDLASEIWKPEVDIRVDVNFQKLGAQLADAQPSRQYKVRGQYYTMGMAKIIEWEDLNAKEDPVSPAYFDVKMRISNADIWYFGTDGRPPADKFDLPTACLHELFHGLGMTGFNYKFTQNGGHLEARSNYPNLRMRFEDFLSFTSTDGKDCALRGIKNDPIKLAQALTGNNLWFSTHKGRIARMYAPKKFVPASVYHLDQRFYGNDNKIMKTIIRKGTADHQAEPEIVKIIRTIKDPLAIPPPTCEDSAVPLRT